MGRIRLARLRANRGQHGPRAGLVPRNDAKCVGQEEA